MTPRSDPPRSPRSGATDDHRRRIARRVLVVLSSWDLSGLEPDPGGRTRWDEYEPEARALARLLHTRGRVTRADVSDTWKTWFDDDLARLTTAEWKRLLADLNAIPALSK